jgi:hypothetical protein
MLCTLDVCCSRPREAACCQEAQCNDTADFRLTVTSTVEDEVMCLFLWFASPQASITADVFTRVSVAHVEILRCRVDTTITGVNLRGYFSIGARQSLEMVTSVELELISVRAGA